MIWRALYALTTWLVLPLVLIYFAWRSRAEPDYRRHWGERLGLVPPRDDGPVWIHAASVGEAVLAAPLIESLRAHRPNLSILVTTMTPTGRAEIRRRLGDIVDACYVPLDTRGATRRFFARVRPRLGVLVETELWPHLVGAAAEAGVPLALVNATISARSAARYKRPSVRGAVAFMLAHIDSIAAASQADAERFTSLGAAAERVFAPGNLKYDLVLPDALEENATARRAEWQAMARLVWVAASTHAGEEAELVKIFTSLRVRFPALLLVLVPRHPQRFDSVAETLAATGHNVSRRSRGECVDAGTDIVLADTLGELLSFYALADVAFVGGTLVPGIGGHNVIEPAAAGCAIVTGPYVSGWQEPLAMLGPGAVVANDPATLEDTLAGWLADPAERERIGHTNRAAAAAHRGALATTTARLLQRLPEDDRRAPAA